MGRKSVLIWILVGAVLVFACAVYDAINPFFCKNHSLETVDSNVDNVVEDVKPQDELQMAPRYKANIVATKVSGVYKDKISVIFEDEGKNLSVKLFYTLNGDDPTENDTQYENEIVLEPTDEYTVYPVKLVAFLDGKKVGAAEYTYILQATSDNLEISFISITSDYHNLYDSKTGIMVFGREDDPYGNFEERDDSWMRDAHLYMVDENQKELLNQNILLGISGGTSSKNDVKSLKISAVENEHIALDLLPYDIETAKYSFVNKYSSLRLRMGSQDMAEGNIRSAIASRLVAQSGYDGCTTTKRAVVFLNGQFYGICDIQQIYTDGFIRKKYNLDESALIETEKSCENLVQIKYDLDKYFESDLNIEANRNKLEACVDMDNYLFYYAINVLLNNTDWPNNNYEVFRYNGESDSNLYSDGRLRFLMYDMDMIYPNELTTSFFESVRDDVFDNLMNNTGRANYSYFSSVMKSEVYKKKFVNIVCDLFNKIFTSDNIKRIIREEQRKILPVQRLYYSSEDATMYEENVDAILDAALKREEQLADDFNKYFDLKKKYQFSIVNGEGVSTYWGINELYASEKYNCNYYIDSKIELNAKPYPGYAFEYWLVNGEKVYGNTILINKDSIKNGSISIKTICKKLDEGGLLITGVSAKGDNDWVEITNTTAGTVKLSDYFITDKEGKLRKSQLENVNIEAGKSIKLYGDRNPDGIGKATFDFSISDGETVFLTDGESILDKIEVPNMTECECYKRYKLSNVWKYEVN